MAGNLTPRAKVMIRIYSHPIKLAGPRNKRKSKKPKSIGKSKSSQDLGKRVTWTWVIGRIASGPEVNYETKAMLILSTLN